MQTILTSLLVLAVLDVEYPKKVDEHVNDFAKILSPDQVAVIKKAASEVRTNKKIPIVVCTVQSLEDYGAHDWSIQRYAAALYSDWGIGDKDQNQGVLLFVSIEDRKLRIALGDGLSASFSEPSREVVDRVIVPRFKKGDFGGGIVAGVQGIAERLNRSAGATPARPSQPQHTPTPAPAPAFRHPPARVGEEAEWRVPGVSLPGIGTHMGSGCCGLIVILVVVAVIGSAARSVFRGRGGMIGGGYGGPRMGGGGYWGGGGGGSGWGGLLMGGLIGNVLTNMFSGRGGGGMSMGGGGGWSGGGSSGGGGGGGGGGWSSGGSSSSGGDWGGGSSSSGGGFSSGGGASGEW
jgi:uncharacterized protein